MYNYVGQDSKYLEYACFDTLTTNVVGFENDRPINYSIVSRLPKKENSPPEIRIMLNKGENPGYETVRCVGFSKNLEIEITDLIKGHFKAVSLIVRGELMSNEGLAQLVLDKSK